MIYLDKFLNVLHMPWKPNSFNQTLLMRADLYRLHSHAMWLTPLPSKVAYDAMVAKENYHWPFLSLGIINAALLMQNAFFLNRHKILYQPSNKDLFYKIKWLFLLHNGMYHLYWISENSCWVNKKISELQNLCLYNIKVWVQKYFSAIRRYCYS